MEAKAAALGAMVAQEGSAQVATCLEATDLHLRAMGLQDAPLMTLTLTLSKFLFLWWSLFLTAALGLVDMEAAALDAMAAQGDSAQVATCLEVTDLHLRVMGLQDAPLMTLTLSKFLFLWWSLFLTAALGLVDTEAKAAALDAMAAQGDSAQVATCLEVTDLHLRAMGLQDAPLMTLSLILSKFLFLWSNFLPKTF